LVRIGQVAVPSLRGSLNNDDDDLVLRVVRVLGQIESDSSRTREPLKALLWHENPIIQIEVAEVLLRWAQDRDLLIERGRGLLKCPDSTVRARSAQMLGGIGSEALVARVDLVERLGDLDWSVRIASCTAIWQVTSSDKEILPVLKAGLRDPDTEVRWKTANALIEIGAGGKRCVPDLINVMVNEFDKMVRMAAADALGAMGPEARSAVPTLKRALKDRDGTVITAAADALKLIDPVEFANLGFW
jgi:HEAT repeat protein